MVGTGVGQFFGNMLLDSLLGAQAFSPPANWFFALMTVTPTDTGGGTEVAGGGYGRVSVTNNTANFPSASGATLNTGITIDWGTATANWGTITTIAQYDANTTGNLGPYGPLTVPTLINNGSSFKVLSGNGTYQQL